MLFSVVKFGNDILDFLEKKSYGGLAILSIFGLQLILPKVTQKEKLKTFSGTFHKTSKNSNNIPRIM